MNLGIDGYTYDDLYSYARLRDLALTFDRFVEEHDADLFARFDAYRHAVQSGTEHGGLTTPDESALLIAVGQRLAVFLARMFGIEQDVIALHERTRRDAEVARFKKEFVAKRVAKVQSPAPSEEFTLDESDPELGLAIAANRLLDLEKQS